ncbi:MAG: MgtC/SapB family protein [Clostridiales bacterium]|jgi:putative Mg2+ transporter-C (MgtC) family protein|nr:MgtC/SapB family protein [Clostridiales bacterium]
MVWEDALKLILAMVLGGLVGLEREITNRPAGFRTHTLVCMGSALVMITSQYIFDEYHSLVNLDPARLGAQVISGIGFLGAGTIMKDEARVRGLTTAASLWVVACIGLAAGAGLYQISIFAAFLVYIVLILLKKIEALFRRNTGVKVIKMDIRNVPGQIAKVTDCMGQLKVLIRDIKLEPSDEPWVHAKFYIRLPRNVTYENLLTELKAVEGVRLSPDDD